MNKYEMVFALRREKELGTQNKASLFLLSIRFYVDYTFSGINELKVYFTKKDLGTNIV